VRAAICWRESAKFGPISQHLAAPSVAAPWNTLWTWTALDADSKLIVGWLVGDRDAEAANAFMLDVAGGRLVPRVQLTTDAHKPYLVGRGIG
jgi:hypothetical protein